MIKSVFVLILFISFFFVGITNGQTNMSSDTLSLQSKITPKQLSKFYNSFVVVEGRFRGAYIGKIKSYTEMTDIINFINQKGFSIDKDEIYKGYKPRKRGCKKNPKWICLP